MSLPNFVNSQVSDQKLQIIGNAIMQAPRQIYEAIQTREEYLQSVRQVYDNLFKNAKLPILSNAQLECCNNLLLAYKGGWMVALNTSIGGAGKTIMAIWLAITLRLPLFVICKSMQVNMWRTEAAKYGCPIINVYAYTIIRGNKGKASLNQDIITISESNEKGKKDIYGITQTFKNIIDVGCFLVADEASEVKNIKASQFKALKALINAIVELGVDNTSSRVNLLSATLYDHPRCAITFLRLLGFVTKQQMSKVTNGVRTMEGLDQLVFACRQLDEELTIDICGAFGVVVLGDNSRLALKPILEPLCHTLFCKIILPNIKHGTIVREYPDLKVNEYKVICKMEGNQDLENARRIIDMGTRGAISIRENNVRIDSGKVDWSAMTKGMQFLELYLTNSAVHISLVQLGNNAGLKVIIFAEYCNTIDTLYMAFMENGYMPVILDGRCVNKEYNMSKFMNDDNCRVALVNYKVGAMGIDLHDTTGRHDRLTICLPTFIQINVSQACCRTVRFGSKGTATNVILLPGDELMMENSDASFSSVIDKLDQRSFTMSEVNALNIEDINVDRYICNMVKHTIPCELIRWKSGAAPVFMPTTKVPRRKSKTDNNERVRII